MRTSVRSSVPFIVHKKKYSMVIIVFSQRVVSRRALLQTLLCVVARSKSGSHVSSTSISETFTLVIAHAVSLFAGIRVQGVGNVYLLHGLYVRSVF